MLFGATFVLGTLRGWPLRHFDLPEGVPKIFGRELQEWTRFLQRPELLSNVRLDVAGVEKIPREGPVIAVFNHRSYFDAPVVTTVLGQTGRSFRFLGKKEVFDAPVVGQLMTALGGIRVDEGTGAVLDESGAAIPGLFSAGRTATGICSDSYVSGLSLADCVYAGRRAGKSAANEADS